MIEGPAGKSAVANGALWLMHVTLSPRVLKPCVGCALRHLTLSFTLSHAATVAVTLERKTGRGWRRVGGEQLQFAAGATACASARASPGRRRPQATTASC